MGRHLAALLALPLVGSFASCQGDESRDRPPAGNPAGLPPPSTSSDDPQGPGGRSLPALSGGTLLVLSDEDRVVVSDPDRDHLFVVRLSTGDVLKDIQLEDGAEPGRAVEDASGDVHVVLRGTDAVLTLDPENGETRTAEACQGPRGIAYDAANDTLYVTCVLGDLWNIAAADGKLVKSFELEPDLRDVVVVGDRIFVSKFRSAEVLLVSHEGDVTARQRPEALGASFTGNVAWRMAAFGEGVVVAHQRSANREIPVGPETEDGTYISEGDCSQALVQAAVTTYREESGSLVARTVPLSTIHLPLDVATSKYASEITVPSTGMDAAVKLDPVTAMGDCILEGITVEVSPQNQPVAAGYSGEHVVLQTRNPPSIVVFEESGPRTISLGDAVTDPGHELFHFGKSVTGISCASCHPEGRDDGHVWGFSDVGTRRTQQLLGGISGSAPFHWSGDLDDFNALMAEVFERRMGQGPAGPNDVQAMINWLDGLPNLPQRPGREAGTPGRDAFEKAKCSDCHAGEAFQTGGSHDVGTGGKFQVPSLRGVASRAPFMHDGCAPTLQARFDDDACGGGSKHGEIDALTAVERASLIDYLKRL